MASPNDVDIPDLPDLRDPSLPPLEPARAEVGPSLPLEVDLDWEPARSPAVSPPAAIPDLDLARPSPAEPRVEAPDEGKEAPIELGVPLALATAPGPSALAPAPQAGLGRPQAPRAPEVDPREVIALAGFGPAPRSLLAAAQYALRVRGRLAALTEQLERQRQLLADAERGQELQLSRMAEGVKASTTDAGAALRERLAEHDSRAAEREAELKKASSTYAADVGTIDEKIQRLETARAEQEAAANEARAEAERRAEERQRAEARSKRVEIELRAAHEVARAAAGPDAKHAPPENARIIRDLEAERDVRARELAVAKKASDEAAEAARGRDGKLRATRAQIAKLREDRGKLEKEASRQLEERSAGAGEAERARVEAHAKAARALLAASPEVFAADERSAAAEAQRLVDDRALSIDKLVRALSAYDVAGVRRGNAVLIAAAAAVLLLIVLAVLLR